jgi:hypothetical protein
MSHQSRPSNGTVFDDASTVNLHRVADTNIVRGGTPLYSFTNLVSLLLENVFNYKRKSSDFRLPRGGLASDIFFFFN